MPEQLSPALRNRVVVLLATVYDHIRWLWGWARVLQDRQRDTVSRCDVLRTPHRSGAAERCAGTAGRPKPGACSATAAARQRDSGAKRKRSKGVLTTGISEKCGRAGGRVCCVVGATTFAGSRFNHPVCKISYYIFRPTTATASLCAGKRRPSRVVFGLGIRPRVFVLRLINSLTSGSRLYKYMKLCVRQYCESDCECSESGSRERGVCTAKSKVQLCL